MRVVRGSGLNSSFSPPKGFRYDGLYGVDDSWYEKGVSGYIIWRYRLRNMHAEIKPPQIEKIKLERAHRVETTTLRIIRDTKQSKRIKKLYDYRCQFCGTRLNGRVDGYAEAAHIRPLGRPHDGPDIPENILCLCPNHHVLFDMGVISLREDLTFIGLEGRLKVHTTHNIGKEFINYL